MSLEKAVVSTEDMDFCLTPDCGAVFIKEGREHNCLSCKKSFCLDCKVESHVGMSCAEYRVNNTDDS